MLIDQITIYTRKHICLVNQSRSRHTKYEYKFFITGVTTVGVSKTQTTY